MTDLPRLNELDELGYDLRKHAIENGREEADLSFIARQNERLAWKLHLDLKWIRDELEGIRALPIYRLADAGPTTTHSLFVPPMRLWEAYRLSFKGQPIWVSRV